MSANKKGCIQRRIIDFLKEHFKWIFFLPLIASIIAAGLFFVFPQFGYSEINILLTIDIAFFAGVQGYSTYTQVRLAEERNRIEDTRNELEKAYGPLYALLNKFSIDVVDVKKECVLRGEEKRYLDQIMASCSYMFSSEIYDMWRSKVQNLTPTVHVRTFKEWYKIPVDFRTKINEEYDRKVEEYYRLLKKE